MLDKPISWEDKTIECEIFVLQDKNDCVWTYEGADLNLIDEKPPFFSQKKSKFGLNLGKFEV